jgi:serine/threonine protein kinase
MALAPGTRVGPYEVVALLGQGGMGEVYRALDTNLKRWVALKVLPEAVAEDADRLARFQREAEVLAALNHPNIAHIYGLEKSAATDGGAGLTALVMELVEGPTLTDKIAGTPVPLSEALSIARQIAEALEAAHGRGIIHRDLKPANIKIRDDGRVKVLDFGLAKPTVPLSPSPDPALSESPTATSPLIGAAPAAWSTVTAHGMIVGTAAYMSPEQARAKPVDKRTDIWSFGCVLFEMLSGRRPFYGATLADVLVAVLSKEPDWSLVSGVAPPHILRLLRHCLEKDPARRLRDIGDAQLELEASDMPAKAPAAVPGMRLPTSWILSAAAVAVLAIVGTMAWRWSDQSGSSDVVWRSRALVTSSSEEFDSRISPDGRWMSFLSSAGGKTQLLIQRLDGGEVRPVTVPAGEVLGQLWSPDGSQLAYGLRQGASTFLQIVPAFFGGVPVRSIGLEPAPNQVRLVRWIAGSIYLQSHHDTGRSLQRINLAGGDIVNVSQTWAFKGTLRDFDVSADGTSVAFTALTDGQEDLWIADLNGASPRRLTNDAFFDSEPLFSTGSSAVIFRSPRGGQIDLWQVDVATGRFARLTSSESDEVPESTTADGKVVSFRQTSGDSNLFTWDPSTNVVTEVTDDALSDFAPTATPDGKVVVFQRSRPGATLRNPLANSTLFLGALEGLRFRTEPTPVTDGYAAQLSPDGSRLAYLHRDSETSAGTLLVKHLQSGETVTLSVTCPGPSLFPPLSEWADHNLAWSASGTDLYFVDRPDTYVVRRYQAGGARAGEPSAVANPNEIIHDLQLSTNGDLAYVVRAKGGSTLHFIDGSSGKSLGTLQLQGTVSARGWLTGEKGLVVARAAIFKPDFTADVEILIASAAGAVRTIGVVPNAFIATTRFDASRSVLYVARHDGTARNLYEVSLHTGRLRRVTDNTLPGVSFAGVEPLPRGALIGVRHEQKSDIWLLDATPAVVDPVAPPGR